MTYLADLLAEADRVHDPVSVNPDVLAAFGAGRKVRPTQDHLELLAYAHPGAPLELTADTAYLTLRGVEFYAELERASR